MSAAATRASVDKRAGIGGILEDRADARLIGCPPDHIAEAVTTRQAQILLPQRTHHLGGGLARQKQLEHQREPVLHFAVLMLEHLPRWIALLTTLSYVRGVSYYIDAALGLALLSLASTLVACRYVMRGGPF